MTRPFRLISASAIAVSLALATTATAQSSPSDSALAHALSFRNIGPALMGGRITSIAAVPNASGQWGTVFYIGAATGGVWRSENAGVSWTPVFDSVRTGGVGAVAVAPSDPDVIWVGTGEANNMRSSSWGTGVYNSTNGGKTWSAAMLPLSQHIGRIVIDPRDPNVVYVAAVGPLWAPGGERGLYKTTDGGKTWTNTKEISKYTGFTDIAMDPSNPDVLYAASEERERREYGFLPAGPEAAIYKTTDGAKTWTKLSEGLPTGELGRIGLATCKSHPATVYAIISAKGDMNGTYRSDDAGAHWTHVNNVDGTAWYYSGIICDPVDADHVIELNAGDRQTWDGGKTWEPFAAGTHTDHHALWINPENPQQIILGGDGGVYQTWDRGQTWDHVENMVVSQFYTVAVDDARPFYNVYGGLQDNQTYAGPSRTRYRYGPTNAMWFRMSGGDGFYAVPDPNDRHLVYAESQQAGVQRYDERTGEAKSIRPTGPHGEHLRFNWSAPILPSIHERNTVYIAAQYLFKSTNRGDSWTMISPDLTRGIDRNKLPMRGAVPDSGELGRNEGTAEFGNITTIDESPMKEGLLAVGTDDGLIQVSQNDGKTWTKIRHVPRRARHDVREPRDLVGRQLRPPLRDVRRPPQQRLQTVRAGERRLWKELDVHRGQSSRDVWRGSDPRGSAPAEPAVRGYGVRRLFQHGPRRPLESAHGRFPGRAGVGHEDPGARERSGAGHARPRHLDHGRHQPARASGRGETGQDGVPVPGAR